MERYAIVNTQRMWKQVIDDILENGLMSNPNGVKTIELMNYQLITRPWFRLANFAERKLNLRYIVGEFCWYLRGNPNDISITHYSKFWQKLMNKEQPYFNSNYGAPIFRDLQFQHVINTLLNDPASRQACIIINRKDVMMSDSKDKICTYAINFHIRQDRLHMTVSMRSNDLIKGLMIDFFQFSVIQEMVYVMLRDEKYENLKLGDYTHKTDSLHIYEQDFEMVKQICANHGSNFEEIEVPKISSSAEVYELLINLEKLERAIRLGEDDLIKYRFNPEHKFFNWCVEKLYKN